jgi:hypothetical protein
MDVCFLRVMTRLIGKMYITWNKKMSNNKARKVRMT